MFTYSQTCKHHDIDNSTIGHHYLHASKRTDFINKVLYCFSCFIDQSLEVHMHSVNALGTKLLQRDFPVMLLICLEQMCCFYSALYVTASYFF